MKHKEQQATQTEQANQAKTLPIQRRGYDANQNDSCDNSGSTPQNR